MRENLFPHQLYTSNTAPVRYDVEDNIRMRDTRVRLLNY